MSNAKRARIIAELIARLRQERRAKGMTLTAVASRAGLSIATVQRLELQARMPSIDTLLRMASALDLGLGEILLEAERAA